MHRFQGMLHPFPLHHHALANTIRKTSQPGEENFDACSAFALAAFSAVHAHPSTDEKKVEASLVEKFDLFGDSLKADSLKTLFKRAIAIRKSSFDDFRIHDVLKLLLLLSSSPLKEKYEPRPDRAEMTTAELWDLIVQEDPLEGDHWNCSLDDEQSSFYDTDRETDASDAEVGTQADENTADETQDPDTTLFVSDVSETFLDEEDDDAFSLILDANELRSYLPTQYWRQHTGPRPDLNLTYPIYFGSIIDDPSSLSPALAAEQSTNRAFFSVPVTPTIYIAESDILRECLSVCAGFPSEIFSSNNDGNIHPTPNVSLKHTSHRTLLRMLEPVAEVGNKIKRLEYFIMRSTSPPQTPNPTLPHTILHTLATVLRTHLMHFTQNLPTPSTLLSFLHDLSTKSYAIQELDSFLNQSGIAKAVADRTACEGDDLALLILDKIFEEVLRGGAGRREVIFRGLLGEVIRPCFSEFGRWFGGNRVVGGCEVIGLCIERNSTVTFSDIEFWQTRYRVLEKVPRILKGVIESILIGGKCMDLLRHLDPVRAFELAQNSQTLFENFINTIETPQDSSSSIHLIGDFLDREVEARKEAIDENGLKRAEEGQPLFLFKEMEVEMEVGRIEIRELRIAKERDVDLGLEVDGELRICIFLERNACKEDDKTR
ncbi:Gamma-tubulin complex component 5 [Dinochytrium kinnereticum]|nr:Gamma-tubulin complex component 5 [Dinochytrium kinnereticum]